MGFDAGDSNLYRYVKNQPITNSDPSGNRLVATTENVAKFVRDYIGNLQGVKYYRAESGRYVFTYSDEKVVKDALASAGSSGFRYQALRALLNEGPDHIEAFIDSSQSHMVHSAGGYLFHSEYAIINAAQIVNGKASGDSSYNFLSKSDIDKARSIVLKDLQNLLLYNPIHPDQEKYEKVIKKEWNLSQAGLPPKTLDQMDAEIHKIQKLAMMEDKFARFQHQPLTPTPDTLQREKAIGNHLRGLVETVGSFVPRVGEGIDALIIKDPKSTDGEKTLAAISLFLNEITGGILPNAGPWIRARRGGAHLHHGGELGMGVARNAPLNPAGQFQGRQFWNRSTTFQGNRVFQRNDLIDPARVDRFGRTNLQRMERGLAPIGPDGESINLHHLIQTQDGGIAEMTATFHQEYSRIIHINPNTIPSGINRPAFDAWRRAYWMNRANDFRLPP